MQVTANSFTPSKPSGFLVFDGVNGAGKSTQLNALLDYLNQKGIACTSTREPGGTKLGQAIREILMTEKQVPLAPLAETFLFAADRAHHVQNTIKPAIKKTECIISDRYYYSTLAFQGYGRGIDLEQLILINEIAISGTKPDLVFLFDLDPAEGLRRARERNAIEHDSFEQEALDFHTRLRDGFLKLSNTLPEPFAIIDASKSQDEVWQAILPYVDKWLASLKGKT